MQQSAWGWFVSRFKTKLREFQGGEKLLRRLEQTACGTDYILMLLQSYCGAQVESYARQYLIALLASKRSLAHRYAKSAERLRDVAGEIEATTKELSQLLMPPLGHLPGLPDLIRSYASLLTATSEDLHNLSLRNIPIGTLNIIADCMKGSTGTVDRKEMALLLEIGYATFGVRKSLTADDVTRLLRRAARRRTRNKNPTKRMTPTRKK
jgi:hypothetical protein